MLGVTTFVIPMGIQTVLYPWLIVVELQESADRLGLAQMSSQLPGLCLILIGGVMADRLDPRKILIAVHCLACLPAIGLSILLYQGHLTFGLMLAYAVLMGTFIAFAAPARDGMLNRIANGKLQQTVTITMGLTFGAQIIGFVAASFAESVGPIPLLALQSTIMLVGAYTAYRLLPAQGQVRATHGSPIEDIKAGLRVVLQSESMRSVSILLAFMSMFFGGAFMVLNPIIVRDIYSGGAAELAMAFTAFMLGTIAMTIFLVSIGGLKNQGRGLLLALVFGGLALGSASLHLPFWGYLTALFFWGIGGGVAMSMGRTIMQEAAPEAYRARVMSIFSLANMGGMPIGALLMGYCAVWIGPLLSLLIAISGVWIAGLIVFFTTNLAKGKDPRLDQTVSAG